MSEPQAVETLCLPSSLDQLEQIDQVVERMAREMGFAEEVRSDLGICVTEAAGNAIVHAHGERAEIPVEICIERYADHMQISVRDHGPGFYSQEIPDPTLPENLLKDHGRGLHLIRALMDHVEIRRLPDGMQIIMIKKLPLAS
ncbi:ATP-binding protein [candidate division KSB1 bacterium]|nr:MAG: ATP-binding protein [candidate division KSB1 bacterium]